LEKVAGPELAQPGEHSKGEKVTEGLGKEGKKGVL